METGKLDYCEFGAAKAKPALVLLHGWGKKKEDYRRLAQFLSSRLHVYVIDLPGFGPSPLRAYDLADFAEAVLAFLEEKKLTRVILAGHSFGGSVAIVTARKHPERVAKLILLGSAGIRPKTPKIVLGRILSAILPSALKKWVGPLFQSGDYREASGLVRETMRNVVSRDLTPQLPDLAVPTLLIWGRQDHTTPLAMGEKMAGLIPGSKLEVIPGDHGLPYRRFREVGEIILKEL